MRQPSEYFCAATMELWEAFTQHFRNSKTRETYFGDINEFVEMAQKDFLSIEAADVRRYYQEMKRRVEEQKIRSKTLEKKLKNSMHSPILS